MKATKNISNYIVSGERNISVQVKDNKIYKIGRKRHSIVIEKQPGDEYIINFNDEKHIGEIISLKQNHCVVSINGNTYNLSIETERSYKRLKQLKKETTQTNLKLLAPLPGVINDVLVTTNQKVNKGEALLILEAMKMQNEIQSPATGVIKNINVKKGECIIKNQAMLELEIR
jgi:glutaconyl-CoA/methylmalonyl-CoA decarboxylase subunit gamma